MKKVMEVDTISLCCQHGCVTPADFQIGKSVTSRYCSKHLPEYAKKAYIEQRIRELQRRQDQITLEFNENEIILDQLREGII